MSIYTATPKKAKEIGRHTGTIKTRMWVNLPISFWALVEQIRTHPKHEEFENVDETMCYCIMQTARKLGLEC